MVIAAVIMSSCHGKTIVKKLANADSKTETRSIKGSLYHLPLTVVKVDVPLKMNKKNARANSAILHLVTFSPKKQNSG